MICSLKTRCQEFPVANSGADWVATGLSHLHPSHACLNSVLLWKLMIADTVLVYLACCTMPGKALVACVSWQCTLKFHKKKQDKVGISTLLWKHVGLKYNCTGSLTKHIGLTTQSNFSVLCYVMLLVILSDTFISWGTYLRQTNRGPQWLMWLKQLQVFTLR